MGYTAPLEELIEQFRRFAGVGAKSAQRMAFQVLAWDDSIVANFADCIKNAKQNIKLCPQCFNFSSGGELCSICTSPRRNKNLLCVVANARDLVALERTHEYHGVYHVLHGLLSPMDGIGPEELRIKELLTRFKDSTAPINEVIFALSPSTEGEATTMYLSKLLQPFDVKLTRLAYGISVGSDIEQTDELTLARALEGRLSC